mmetsp:Transcript_17110/g.42020  ORF Transcript_17110/g.42020 Transcript_17110/m.42020 type:complete len:348 (-) Transcript_17110:122-1165(-)
MFSAHKDPAVQQHLQQLSFCKKLCWGYNPMLFCFFVLILNGGTAGTIIGMLRPRNVDVSVLVAPGAGVVVWRSESAELYAKDVYVSGSSGGSVVLHGVSREPPVVMPMAPTDDNFDELVLATPSTALTLHYATPQPSRFRITWTAVAADDTSADGVVDFAVALSATAAEYWLSAENPAKRYLDGLDRVQLRASNGTYSFDSSPGGGDAEQRHHAFVWLVRGGADVRVRATITHELGTMDYTGLVTSNCEPTGTLPLPCSVPLTSDTARVVLIADPPATPLGRRNRLLVEVTESVNLVVYFSVAFGAFLGVLLCCCIMMMLCSMRGKRQVAEAKSYATAAQIQATPNR